MTILTFVISFIIGGLLLDGIKLLLTYGYVKYKINKSNKEFNETLKKITESQDQLNKWLEKKELWMNELKKNNLH